MVQSHLSVTCQREDVKFSKPPHVFSRRCKALSTLLHVGCVVCEVLNLQIIVLCSEHRMAPTPSPRKPETLCQCCLRWPNIKTTLAQHLVFTGHPCIASSTTILGIFRRFKVLPVFYDDRLSRPRLHERTTKLAQYWTAVGDYGPIRVIVYSAGVFL